MRTGLSIALALGFALFAPAAFAQEAQPAPAPAPIPPPKVVTKTTVETSTGPKAGDDDPTSDHEKVVGHFGVGYLGLTDLPIGTGGTGAAPARGSVNAPIIGVRYWLSEKLGLDLGVGIGITGGSVEVVNGNTTTSTDVAGVFGLAFHGGVPLVFAHQKHMKFLVIPELNVGFATQTETAPAGQTNLGDTTRNGFRLDAGGRIGTEIHFGFIGIPQLSLQATVGVLFAHEGWKVKQDVGNQTNSSSVTSNTFGTTFQQAPWAVFVNNISAIYYLP